MSESVVVTWIIMAVVTILCFIFVRNLQIENVGKKQLVLEMVIGGIYHFFDDMLGEEGRKYVPYLMTVALYIGIANLIGIIGFKPPTKDLDVTAALALMSIVLIEFAGIRRRGGIGWLKSFTKPMAFITPINLMEVFVRPLSLCMRLFGNVLGAFVIMELIKMVVPVFVPVIFSCYFDIFDGLIQAYVFVFLTTLFIKEAIEIE